MENIRMFMTCTGLEVMGAVVEQSAESFVIKKPLVITVVPQGAETYGLAFMPYSPADTEGDVRFFQHNIVSETVEVPENLKNAYIQRTTDIEVVQTV